MANASHEAAPDQAPDQNPTNGAGTPRPRAHAGSAPLPIGKLIIALWLLAMIAIFTLLGILWSGGGQALRTTPAPDASEQPPEPGDAAADPGASP